MQSEVTHLRRSLEMAAPALVPAVACCKSLCTTVGFCMGGRGSTEGQRPAQPQASTMKCLFITQALQAGQEGNPVLVCHGWVATKGGGGSHQCLGEIWQGAVPPTVPHSWGLVEGPLPWCRALGRCSGHDHFYFPFSISQKPPEEPGQLLPL